MHEAGGGELLFAEILNRHAEKIIIRDPGFQVPPHWKRIAGFDHGKTNPTAALVTAIDNDGTIYCLAEYYQPGLTPWQHMDGLSALLGFLQASRIVADPSILYKNQAQADGDFKSIADLYQEAGLSGMWEGENGELAGRSESSNTARSGPSRADAENRLPLRQLAETIWPFFSRLSQLTLGTDANPQRTAFSVTIDAKKSNRSDRGQGQPPSRRSQIHPTVAASARRYTQAEPTRRDHQRGIR